MRQDDALTKGLQQTPERRCETRKNVSKESRRLNREAINGVFIPCSTRGLAAEDPMRRLAQVIAIAGMAFVSGPAAPETLPANAAPCQATPDTWRLAESVDQPAATAPQGPSNGTGQEAPSITGDGTPATVIDDREVEGILGKSVRSTAGEDMGKIIDVIVKRDGQVRAAVIDFGGFLGVGSRKIAVDWGALSFPPSGAVDHIVLNLTRDQVRLAPEYRPGEPVVVLGSANPEQIKPENPSQPENTAPEK